jgi:hypothetical protein
MEHVADYQSVDSGSNGIEKITFFLIVTKQTREDRSNFFHFSIYFFGYPIRLNVSVISSRITGSSIVAGTL